ncbi:MAG: hypothetical protein ACR2KC_07845, partial [Acidimicrobiales bacterium]
MASGDPPDREPESAPEPFVVPLEDEEPEGTELHTGLPPRVESWRRRSATGAILTGFALGLQEALETKRKEPSIVME